MESGTEAINLNFHCEINTLCQPLSVSLLFHLRNNMQLIVQTPLMEKKKGGRASVVNGGRMVWSKADEGGREGVGWGRSGGGVPEERQNTGPETQLVIW